MLKSSAAVAAVLAALAAVPSAQAEFPLAAGKTPAELGGGDWKLAATPEPPTGNPVFDLLNSRVRSDPQELGGVRGDSTADVLTTDPYSGKPVRTAWRDVTLGRPDVVISVLDSGIKWNDGGAMIDLRHKLHLNAGELPVPNHLRSAPLDGSKPCAEFAAADDADGDGVFTVSDYACDDRIDLADSRRNGPAGMLIPQDVTIAFSDGSDADSNGFVDDIAGWDFLDDDNDPFDDVQYGHGTGEARDSSAEANNGGDVGNCPNCMFVPLRVGDSFIADVNHFGEAVIYAVDNGIAIVQEALGTLNNSHLGKQAIDYAYAHRVPIIASAADEAAEHHNWPSNNPHTIVVNSVSKYFGVDDPTGTLGEISGTPRTYLQFNGCTNFSTHITVAVPSSSCSSEATGRGAGVAGLIISAARNAGLTLSVNEIRQLMASGTVGGQTAADDVDFAAKPEPSCSLLVIPTPLCTDPNVNAPSTRVELPLLVETKPYPARAGFDMFYGHGRLNAYRAAAGARSTATIPPEAEISSPDWYRQIDPGAPPLDVRGHVAAPRAPGGHFSCRVQVAPGSNPNNALAPAGDFRTVSTALTPNALCNGADRTSNLDDALLASISIVELRTMFPLDAGNFTGTEHGAFPHTSAGRPNSQPYGFTIRVVVTAKNAANATLTGQDRRNLFLHRDKDTLPGWPKSAEAQLTSDGAAAPLLTDVDGDNRNELVIATSDGEVHAFRRNGSEVAGWPVHGDAPPVHPGGRAFTSGAVPVPKGGAFLSSPAAADLDGDGAPEIVQADLEGKLYAWHADGTLMFKREANPAWSGKPVQPFVRVRRGQVNRTEHGFLASPAIGDLDRDGTREVVIAGMDRHIYAWHGDGSTVAGFPVLVVDTSKVKSIDPVTHAVTFDPDKLGRSNDSAGRDYGQGAIVDSVALGDLTGDGKPEIVIGTNEEYPINEGNEGPINAGNINTASIALLGQTGQLSLANTRLFALKGTGDADGDGLPTTGPSYYLPGWPAKVGIINAGLLPVVGEGFTGSPVLAELQCPLHDAGGPLKVGAIPDAGPGYILNSDATSCYGDSGGATALQTDFEEGAVQIDHPAFPAVGNPAFGDLGGAQPSFVAPVAGLVRALDLVLPDYQVGGQDFSGAWDTLTGQFVPGFPAPQNDLSFLNGPSVADVDGKPGQEIVAGTASMDLQAFGALGLPASGWPKLTADWMVSNPSIGTFGTLDTAADAHRTVVAATRDGRIYVFDTPAGACGSASWPRYRHDPYNSGNYETDGVAPGKPMELSLDEVKVTFKAPGDDLLCGNADHYEILRSRSPIDGSEAGWARVFGHLVPGAPGSPQAISLPAAAGRYVGVRAVDDQGNVGRPGVAALPAITLPLTIR